MILQQLDGIQFKMKAPFDFGFIGRFGRVTTICDIDFFRAAPCTNDMGRMWGSALFQSPEEYEAGAVIDEITNVYTAGAMAFALFGNYKRTRDTWQHSAAAFEVAQKATSDSRADRYPTIEALKKAWEAAKTY